MRTWVSILLLVGLWSPVHAQINPVSLAWDAPALQPGQVAPETYVISRHNTTSPIFVEVGRVPATTLTYQDPVTVPDTYTYRVHALAGTLVSAPSNEVTIAIVLVPPVAGWTACAVEGRQCIFTGTKEVQYGVPGAFFTKTLTNGTACDNGVFGDPIKGIGKFCYWRTLPPTPVVGAPSNLRITVQ